MEKKPQTLCAEKKAHFLDPETQRADPFEPLFAFELIAPRERTECFLLRRATKRGRQTKKRILALKVKGGKQKGRATQPPYFHPCLRRNHRRQKYKSYY